MTPEVNVEIQMSNVEAEAVGLEPTSGIAAAACLPSRFLANSDDFRWLRITSCGGWDRTSVKTVRASHPTAR
jgi:hypothetical protein